MGDALDAAARAAEEALALADAQPRQALALVDDDVIRILTEAGGAAGAARAWWARGLSYRKLGRRRLAFNSLSRARELNLEAGERADAHRVAIPLAFERLVRGQVDEAIADLEAAAGHLDGVEGALARVQLALVLHRAGRDADTLEAWDEAAAEFRRAGSVGNEAKAIFNRAVIRVERGELAGAEDDMSAAGLLYEALDDQIGLAELAHNRGYVAARRGDLGTALRWFDESQRHMTALGMHRPELLLDRADTLAEAGLLGEARAVIEAAVPLLEEGDQQADLAEACLSAARICLALRQSPAAAEWAGRARRHLEVQERDRWLPLADYYETLSRPVAQDGDQADRLLAVSSALRAAGWRSTADDADAMAVRLLIGAGRLDDAAVPLERLRRGRRGRPQLDRVRAWMAEARFRSALARHQSAGRAMDAAVAALAAHQVGVGSLELRAYGAGRVEAAMALAVRVGQAMGSPDRSLRWVERIREAQEAPTVEEDAELARHLEQLRRVTTGLRTAPLSPGEERRLRGQQMALEELVRRRARHAPGRPGALETGARPVGAALAGRALLEYVVVDHGLVALVVQPGRRSRCVDLGPTQEVQRAVAGLHMALTGLVSGRRPTDAGPDDGGRARLDVMLGALAERLISPLELDRTEADAMVVPCGVVASVPWAALPGLTGRPVAVVPSAAAWERAAGRRPASPVPARPGAVLVVAGPGLHHAEAEAEAVRRVWGRSATVLSGAAATVPAVVAALESADLAHFATHGSFRSDSPLLSGLELADGNLTGYDLSRLARVPPTVVLSCCETGMADAAGTGTFGLCGLLLTSGGATVLASVAPVADADAALLTVPFHRALEEGRGPGAALSAARSAPGASTPSALGFCCFGAA